MRKIVGMGETIMDILFRGDLPVAAVHGGSSFNSVVSIGRTGIPCAFVGYAGDDVIGRKTVDFMRENGLDTSFFELRKNEKSALSLAFLNAAGDADYSFYKEIPRISDSWELPVMRQDDILLFGSYFAACEGMRPLVTNMLEKTNGCNGIVYYDLNFRKSHKHELEMLLPVLISNFRKSTIVRGSADDFDVMFSMRDPRQIYNEKISQYCSLFICTAGGGTVTVCTPRGCYDFQVPQIPNVVSTVGAGDNFNAGFACSLFRYGISKSELLRLDEAGWTPLVADACAFAGNACQHTDNYVSCEFGRSYHDFLE